MPAIFVANGSVARLSALEDLTEGPLTVARDEDLLVFAALALVEDGLTGVFARFDGM